MGGCAASLPQGFARFGTVRGGVFACSCRRSCAEDGGLGCLHDGRVGQSGASQIQDRDIELCGQARATPGAPANSAISHERGLQWKPGYLRVQNAPASNKLLRGFSQPSRMPATANDRFAWISVTKASFSHSCESRIQARGFADDGLLARHRSAASRHSDGSLRAMCAYGFSLKAGS